MQWIYMISITAKVKCHPPASSFQQTQLRRAMKSGTQDIASDKDGDEDTTAESEDEIVD